jgi:CRP-like cAMP-binding protein
VLSHQIMQLAQRELASMRDHLVMLGRHTAGEKVAAFLLLLNRPDGATCSNRLELPMSRQDIADFLGLTIETVCRELTLLAQNGTIEIPNRHQIVLVNLTKLKIAKEGCEA